MRILAVDDDPFVLELLKLMGGKVGYGDITTAASGVEALEVVKAPGPAYDCILLDISMPGMDGIDFLRLVRAIPAYAETPIVMLTALSGKHMIDDAFRSGATDYMNKPLDIVELGTRLRMAEEQVPGRDPRGASSADRSATGTGGRRPIDLTEELLIEGVGDLVSYHALGNYLCQLSRAGIAGSQVLAIKLDDIENIYARASAGEFLYVISSVADVISEAFKDSNSLLAYAGNGVFIVVAEQSKLKASSGLEERLDNMLVAAGLEFDNGEAVTARVSASNPIRPSAHRTQRVRRTFDRAIARAETRSERKLEQLAAAPVRLVKW